MTLQTRSEIVNWIRSVRDKVLPCPWCGKQPVFAPTDPENLGDAWASITCVTKSCPTYKGNDGHGIYITDGANVCDDRGTISYMQAALKRWNNRK